MRKPIVALAVFSLLASATTATAGDPPARAAATKKVVVGDNYFSPKKLTVKKGTTVRFVWGADGRGTAVEHNVTATKGNRFATADTKLPAKPVQKKITKTTTIYCTIHATTMKLTIKVKR
jgi:plastocyanin